MKESRKTRYTRNVLKDSLMELLRKKELSKITVKELCDVADINRSSFYRHYRDVYDMVERMEEQLVNAVFGRINREVLTSDRQVELFESIFNELKSMRDEMELIYLNPGSTTFTSRLVGKIYEYSRQLIKELRPELTENEIKHVYAFISMGCAQMVISWLENGMKEDAEKMAILMNQALKGEFCY